MALILDYAFPIAAALLLVVFYAGLPALQNCRLPSASPERRGRGLDVLWLLLITGVYAFVAFTDLGDTAAPQSFVPMAGQSAVFGLEERPAELMLYTGVGMGGYRIEISDNGTDYAPLTEDFTQDHVAVLKWHSLPLETEGQGPCYVKISCTNGEPWLGEVVFRDAEGAALPIGASIRELADEQALVPERYSLSNSTYFDEIYHARTALEHIEGLWPYEISHPPLGKILMGLGIRLFGMTPFGWRFTGTFFGVLMLPLMYAFLKKLYGGGAVPALGTVVFAADFMHFVQTRIATIDTYGVFFILLMYLFFWGWYQDGRKLDLALSGVCFGLGAASKWTCLYAGAGLVAEHPYSSSWWQWLVDARPILYYLEYGEGTVSSIAAFVSPLLCWAGLVSVLLLIVRAVHKRDRRALFIVIGYLAQLVPWMVVSRLTFAYHYFAAVVFLVLALCAVFDEMRAKGHIRWMYAFTGVSLALFAMFYPVLTGVEVSRYYSWKVLKWFPSWPL